MTEDLFLPDPSGHVVRLKEQQFRDFIRRALLHISNREPLHELDPDLSVTVDVNSFQDQQKTVAHRRQMGTVYNDGGIGYGFDCSAYWLVVKPEYKDVLDDLLREWNIMDTETGQQRVSEIKTPKDKPAMAVVHLFQREIEPVLDRLMLSRSCPDSL